MKLRFVQSLPGRNLTRVDFFAPLWVAWRTILRFLEKGFGTFEERYKLTEVNQKILCLFLVIVGVAWHVFNAWLSAGMEMITDWEYSTSIIGWFEGLSPWLLLFGPLFVVTGWLPKSGVVLIVGGCLGLSAETVESVSGLFPLEFSKWNQLYAIFVAIGIITLLADAAALRLAQKIWFSRRNAASPEH